MGLVYRHRRRPQDVLIGDNGWTPHRVSPSITVPTPWNDLDLYECGSRSGRSVFDARSVNQE